MDDFIQFHAYGHPNIKATHKTTLEITKDCFVTETGDCIIGINSDFSFPKDFFLDSEELVIEFDVDGIKESVSARINPDFSSEREIVVRKSTFISERTLAVQAGRACADLSEEFRKRLHDPKTVIKIKIIKNRTRV